MLTTGIFLDAFKLLIIIPLFTVQKGDSSLSVNYRPISLLPTISNVFEKVIHDQLYVYYDKSILLAQLHYCFRKQHSTEYAPVIDHVSNQMKIEKHP